MRRVFATMALVGAAIVAVLAVLSITTASSDYLYVPDAARPLAGNVSIPGRHDRSDARGGIYVVDVTVRQARWAEKLLPFLRPDGATLVPGHAVTARGESFEERRVQAEADMQRSQQIASAVALQQAGYHVVAKPRGALIAGVAPDVPAAGVLQTGDVIVRAAGRPTPTPGALRAALRPVDPGARVALRFRRGSRVLARAVKTVQAPGEPGRAIIGIAVSQDAKIVLPFPVHIDLGRVGGPSAGLPFALEVLQELGRDVDRGYRVAATGELELDGSVEPIGGVKQKTIGVRQSGADVFLVPAGENATEARRYAGNLRIIPVESFQQALRALRTLPQK